MCIHFKHTIDQGLTRSLVKRWSSRFSFFHKEVLKQVTEEKGNITDKLGQVEGNCETF